MCKLKTIIIAIFTLYASITLAVDVPISIFPLAHYNQNVDDWINAKKFPNYHQPLLKSKVQKEYLDNFKQHWLSSWDPHYVDNVLATTHPSIDDLEREILVEFDNTGKSPKHAGYGSNFRAHNEAWLLSIKNQIDLDALSNLAYDPRNRAILVSNTEARALPTQDVSFYQFILPGEGYPFDNLQMSSLWAGTPVYILSQTKNKDWSLILTPIVIAWVPSNTLARVGQPFIRTWSNAEKKKLATIIHTATPFKDLVSHHFYFDAYVGSVFPVSNVSNQQRLIFPIKTTSGFAKLAYAELPENDYAIMPYLATPAHFADIMKTLIGRPYGWGGIYFNNDCSQELRSLYAAFGIWLPRHSSDQVKVGKMENKTRLSPTDRIQYLMTKGHPLMTLVYIKGHVFQYVGNFVNPNDPNSQKMALTYQNVWGLSPSDHSRRAVIGEAVLLPLLDQYPEDTSLASLAAKPEFKVAFLDEPKDTNDTLLGMPLKVNLPSLMLP